MATREPEAEHAVRARVAGPPAPELQEDAVARARALGVLGWVRLEGRDGILVHAEGGREAVAALIAILGRAPGRLEVEEVRPEGHEQFAIRGVSAGAFVVREHRPRSHHFDLRLEVDGAMRSWALPKGPSMDPAVKRMAIEMPERSLAHDDFEGETAEGWVRVWDRGTYERGGRVPWPEALDRGHAVFVLHGDRLEGGFALQRTRGGAKPQWLLIKRRDGDARPGSDVVAEAG